MKLTPPPSSPLTDYLKRSNPALYGKLAELRTEITRWLTYVPHTFSHYTSHTIDHSDEIILQISKLLFEPKRTKPLAGIGPVAAYILIAGAYLHDAGMVAADEEKAKILASDEWREWTTEGSGTERWRETEKLRGEAGGDLLKHFAIDRATRLLVAEFIRRQHHYRAGDFVRSRALELGRVDIGDPILRQAIADICVAHGLDHAELEDDIRFPEATDIQGERVNLRLLATLLRLGDLLDLRTDRACPLLIQAACPLPSDSIAHWTQYKSIEKRLTDTKKIEIRAKCRNQEEHRVLADWCTWIVREIDRLQARLPTTEWKFPRATMAGNRPTITIEPHPEATYIPTRWTFELEQDAVFQRLIADVYDSPSVFLRELIQNALDAMRCRMYQDMKETGRPLPHAPDQAPQEVLERYRINISLREEQLQNDTSDSKETVQVLTIEDQGLGMDREIIERYLLQAGRSYYTTADFRRSFPFPPTSRFGVGFLSVFAVSDHITIETYKPSSPRRDGPLRLKLTGPRSYILLEKGSRTTPGTRIEIRLKKKLTNTLLSLVQHWCVLVEFPIDVEEMGFETTVRRARLEEFDREWPHPFDPSIRYVRKLHRIYSPGIAGGFISVARIEDGQARFVTGQACRDAPIPLAKPEDTLLLHGIRAHEQEHMGTDYLWMFIDWRKNKDFSIQRTAPHIEQIEPELQQALGEIIETHLGPDNAPFNLKDWWYRAMLVKDRRLSGLPIWKKRNDLVLFWDQKNLKTCSLESLLALDSFFIGQWAASRNNTNNILDHEREWSNHIPGNSKLLSSMFPWVTRDFASSAAVSPWEMIFNTFSVVRLERIDQHVVAECRKRRIAQTAISRLGYDDIVAIHDPSCWFDIMTFGHNPTWIVVNEATDFGRWYLGVRKNSSQLRNEVVDLWRKVDENLRSSASIYHRPTRDFTNCLVAWNETESVPQDLKWPNLIPNIHSPP